MDNIKIEKLDELLRPHLGATEEIAHYETKAHTAPGENFGSQMISLDVHIIDKDTKQKRILKLVNKMIPQDPVILAIFNTKVTYIKEMDFYLKAVPAMLKLQQQCGVPQKDWITNIVPKCLGARIGFGNKVDSDAAILLENLNPRGYELKNKKIGLDFNHANLVMEKLAYLHALPIALRKKCPAEYEAGILPAVKFFVRNEDAENKEEMDKKFVDLSTVIFRKLQVNPELIEKAIATTKVHNFDALVESKEPFLTISHEDLWVNNVLFCPDPLNKELPGSLAFVDFQSLLLLSPLPDVVFFLFTSVTPSVRRKHFNELLNTYCENFCKCLRQVQCDTNEFTKEAVLAEMNRVAGSRLFEIFGRLRVIVVRKEEMEGEEWYFNVDLGGEEYLKRLADVVTDFGERGWLDNYR